MIVNNGFLVKNDRFSLTKENDYIISGWLKTGVELTAFVSQQEIPLYVEYISENVDERFGGAPVKVIVRFDEKIPQRGVFKLYSNTDSGRRLSFELNMREIRQKMQPIKIFIDEYRVVPKDDFVHLQGWAVAKEPVQIAVVDQAHQKLNCKIEQYQRLDVVDLFEEYPVDERAGFNIEIRPIPKGPIGVLYKAGECRYIETYPTSVTASRAREAKRLFDKGSKYLKYNGLTALVDKTYNKLFNPAMRPVIYSDWIKKHLPSERILSKQRNTSFANMPLVSIVVPLYQTPKDMLHELIDSVLAQSYSNWELVLSDGSPCVGGSSTMKDILDEEAKRDARIKVIENKKALKIADNTNAALRAAQGELIAFADHDDLLTPNALFEVVRAANEHPKSEMFYSDEDKVGVGNQYLQPNLKPDFDLDLLRSVNYICHLLVVKRSLLDRVGLLNGEFDGAQDYDFVLRCSEATRDIVHIPMILYHWRFFEGSTAANPKSKRYAFDAGRRAIQAHYDRLHLPATALDGEELGIYRTVYHWKEQPLVSVLIPNKDHIEDLKKCLRGPLSGKGWQNFEIIIIENNSTEEETFRYYEEIQALDPRIKVVTYQQEGGFNYSKLNNFGASFAKGDYLFLLNNDTEFISEDVIGELMGFCQREDVGAVGARLYFGDDTIQHAGVIVGWGGIAGHAFVNQHRGETGYQHRIICQQDYSAETAACLMVKRSVFDEIGGFTEELAVAFNDIDLCMKIRRAGYLIVYNPYCELYHYESKSRGLDQGNPEKVRRFQSEMAVFRQRWPEILRDGDPYYNPNLSMVTQDFSLKHL